MSRQTDHLVCTKNSELYFEKQFNLLHPKLLFLRGAKSFRTKEIIGDIKHCHPPTRPTSHKHVKKSTERQLACQADTARWRVLMRITAGGTSPCSSLCRHSPAWEIGRSRSWWEWWWRPGDWQWGELPREQWWWRWALQAAGLALPLLRAAAATPAWCTEVLQHCPGPRPTCKAPIHVSVFKQLPGLSNDFYFRPSLVRQLLTFQPLSYWSQNVLLRSNEWVSWIWKWFQER